MATTLGPLKFLSETRVRNTTTETFSLVTGKSLENPDASPGNTYQSIRGIPAEVATDSPITQIIEIDIPPNVDVKTLVLTDRSIGDYLSGGDGYGAQFPNAYDIVIVKRGLYFVTANGLGELQFEPANTALSRNSNPTLFPVASNANVDPNTGVFNKKLYVTVSYQPFHFPNTVTFKVKPFTTILSLSGKEVQETTPPAPPPPEEPTPSDPPTPPKTPDATPTAKPTPPEDPPEEDPEDPEPTYEPPEETQLSVRVVDNNSIALYGTRSGPEFESDYIETTRQAVRVAEQIIWQANQTIVIAFSVPYDPTVKRGDTIRINSVVYQLEDFIFDFLGLVKSVSHVFDSQTGEVTTQIICRGTEYVFESSLSDSDITEKVDQRDV